MSFDKGFRRIVLLLSLVALASGLLFTVALGVAFVHARSTEHAIESAYTESGCVAGAASKGLVFTSLERGAVGPYRWRVNIPSPRSTSLWSDARPLPPGVIPEDPGPAKVRADQVQSMLFGMWVVSAPRELSRGDLLRAIAVHQKGWLARWFGHDLRDMPARWLGVNLRDMPSVEDLVAAKLYVVECSELLKWDTAETYVMLRKLAGHPSPPLPSRGLGVEFYAWWMTRLLRFDPLTYLLSLFSTERASQYVMWKWYWLPPALALTILASVIPWAVFYFARLAMYFARWVGHGFTET